MSTYYTGPTRESVEAWAAARYPRYWHVGVGRDGLVAVEQRFVDGEIDAEGNVHTLGIYEYDDEWELGTSDTARFGFDLFEEEAPALVVARRFRDRIVRRLTLRIGELRKRRRELEAQQFDALDFGDHDQGPIMSAADHEIAAADGATANGGRE